MRHIFRSDDSPTWAHCALQRTTADKQSEFPEAVESVRNIFNMDDYLDSSQIIGKASPKAQDFVKLLILAGLTLSTFSINHFFKRQSDCKTFKNDIKVLPIAADAFHVLGHQWNHQVDTQLSVVVQVQT